MVREIPDNEILYLNEFIRGINLSMICFIFVEKIIEIFTREGIYIENSIHEIAGCEMQMQMQNANARGLKFTIE